MVSKRTYCLVWALVSVLQVGYARAELWQAQQKVVLGARYDTNLTLSSTNTIETQGRDLQWLGKLSRETETDAFSSQLQLRSAARNAGEGIYDSDDQKAELAYQKNWLNHGVSIDIDYIRDTTLATEFQLTSARIFNVRKRREKFTGNLQAYIDVSSRDKWILNYSQGETQYRDSGILLSALNDFSQLSVSSHWQRSITPNFTSRATVFQFETEVFDITNESKTHGLQLGFIYELSALASLDALVGYRETSRVVDTGFNRKDKADGKGNVFEFNYNYDLKTSSVQLGISRTVDPDVSDGDLLEKTQAAVSYSKQWRPYFLTKLSYFLLRQEQDAAESSRVESAQYALNLLAGVSENLGIGFSYQYIERDLIDSNDKSNGNIYLISLVYSDNAGAVLR